MMATIPIMPSAPPMPAVARILARFERDQLAGFIAVAIDLLDTLDGDTDRESPGAEDDFEIPAQQLRDNPTSLDPNGDTEGGAWIEWTTMRGSEKRSPNLIAGQEDDELDDLAEDDDPAEDGDNDRAVDDVAVRRGVSGP